MNAGLFGVPSKLLTFKVTVANSSNAPVAPKVGDLWHSLTTGKLQVWTSNNDANGAWTNTSITASKSASIFEPVNTDKPTLCYTNSAVTIAEIRTVVRGTSPSVTATYYWGADRTGASNTTIQATIVTTNTTSGNIQTSFSNSTPAANSFLWFDITAVSGTVTEYHVTVRFT